MAASVRMAPRPAAAWRAARHLVAPIVVAVPVAGACVASARIAQGPGQGAAIERLALFLALCGLVLFAVERFAERAARALRFDLISFCPSMLRTALPARERSIDDRLADTAPATERAVRDMFDEAHRAPGRAIRWSAGIWSLYFLMFFAGDAGWHLRTGAPSFASLVAIVLAAGLFALAFSDMARLRRRALRGPWALAPRSVRVEELGSYSPARLPTTIPTVPVLFVVLAPCLLASEVWMDASSSWTTRFEAATAALTFLLFAWSGRSAATGVAMRRCERATSALSDLVGRAVLPTWRICRGICLASFGAGLLTFAVAATAPAVYRSSLDPWAEVGVVFIALGFMLALVLKEWRRPTEVAVVPASELLCADGRQAVVARATMLLTRALGLAALGWLVAASLG